MAAETSLNVESFIILRLGEGITPFNKDNSANCSGESTGLSFF